jgi:hypothetical protein
MAYRPRVPATEALPPRRVASFGPDHTGTSMLGSLPAAFGGGAAGAVRADATANAPPEALAALQRSALSDAVSSALPKSGSWAPARRTLAGAGPSGTTTGPAPSPVQRVPSADDFPTLGGARPKAPAPARAAPLSFGAAARKAPAPAPAAPAPPPVQAIARSTGPRAVHRMRALSEASSAGGYDEEAGAPTFDDEE